MKVVDYVSTYPRMISWPVETLVGGGLCGIYLFSHLSTDVWELLSEQTVRNDRTSRFIESFPPHSTVCLVAA